jgi:hypothetical protein
MKSTRRFSSPTAFLAVAATLGVATVISTAGTASAMSGPITLDFVCSTITPAPAVPTCPSLASQFKAVVAPVVNPVGTIQARFTFTNVGGINSSITKIDFADKAQYSLASKASTSSTGGTVVFNNSTSTVATVQNFLSTSAGTTNAAKNKNGINPAETYSILFDIIPGFKKPFNAVVTDLFKRGLSIQLTSTFSGVKSPTNKEGLTGTATFNSKTRAVPEPFTILGSGAALGFGALMKRRASKLKAKNGDSMTTIEPTLETVA